MDTNGVPLLTTASFSCLILPRTVCSPSSGAKVAVPSVTPTHSLNCPLRSTPSPDTTHPMESPQLSGPSKQLPEEQSSLIPTAVLITRIAHSRRDLTHLTAVSG